MRVLVPAIVLILMGDPDVEVLKGHDWTVFSVAFTQDGNTLISGSADSTIKFWDLESKKAERTLTIGDDMVRVVAISPDEKRIAAADDVGKVRIWDAETGKRLRTITAHKDEIRGLAFHPDGETLASAGGGALTKDSSVKIWDVATGKRKHLLGKHEHGVDALVFRPDGKILASGSAVGGQLFLWDPDSGKLVREIEGAETYGALAFLPDGKTLAGLGDEEIFFWDTETGELLRQFEVGEQREIALRPDGKVIATGSSLQLTSMVTLWSVESGKKILEFKAHRRTVPSFCFSPDGKILATGGDDHTIKLWDLSKIE